jgi:hypothetical protein
MEPTDEALDHPIICELSVLSREDIFQHNVGQCRHDFQMSLLISQGHSLLPLDNLKAFEILK